MLNKIFGTSKKTKTFSSKTVCFWNSLQQSKTRIGYAVQLKSTCHPDEIRRRRIPESAFYTFRISSITSFAILRTKSYRFAYYAATCIIGNKKLWSSSSREQLLGRTRLECLGRVKWTSTGRCVDRRTDCVYLTKHDPIGYIRIAQWATVLDTYLKRYL